MRFLFVLCTAGALMVGGAAYAHPTVSGQIVIHDGPVSVGLHLPPWHHHAHARAHPRHYPHYVPHPRRHAPWGHHGPSRYQPHRRPAYHDTRGHRQPPGHRAPRGHHHSDECYLFYEKRHPHWRR